MSENTAPDISKIVGVLMENPKLIEEISSLLQRSETKEAVAEATEEAAMQEEASEETVKASVSPISPTYHSGDISGSNRTQLLCAFKPYLSKERSRAIDTMLSISDILRMMRTR